jgi:hypothetical protein
MFDARSRRKLLALRDQHEHLTGRQGYLYADLPVPGRSQVFHFENDVEVAGLQEALSYMRDLLEQARKLKEDTASQAKAMTDEELAAEIARNTELDLTVFLVLMQERDKRGKS